MKNAPERIISFQQKFLYLFYEMRTRSQGKLDLFVELIVGREGLCEIVCKMINDSGAGQVIMMDGTT